MAKILVADDSVFQRTNLRYLLEFQGHQVLEAGNGQAALALASERTPDCIVLDVIMPQTNGLAVLEMLLARGDDVPVIVLTADIQTSTRQRCLDLGASVVVEKPVEGDHLLALIDELTEGKPTL